MLRKICGFHGGDYEECRLLGYKSQIVLHREHVSATETSRLMLRKICGFHGGDYEECRLQQCGAVQAFENRCRFYHHGDKNRRARNLTETTQLMDF
jgi:hypothetical protein